MRVYAMPLRSLQHIPGVVLQRLNLVQALCCLDGLSVGVRAIGAWNALELLTNLYRQQEDTT